MGSTFVRTDDVGDVAENGGSSARDPLNWVLLFGFVLCLLFWLAFIVGVAALK